MKIWGDGVKTFAWNFWIPTLHFLGNIQVPPPHSFLLGLLSNHPGKKHKYIFISSNPTNHWYYETSFQKASLHQLLFYRDKPNVSSPLALCTLLRKTHMLTELSVQIKAIVSPTETRGRSCPKPGHTVRCGWPSSKCFQHQERGMDQWWQQ